MNNAISRLIESATADATEHAGKHWWDEMSPENQEKYLREHPGSSKEENKSTDVVPHGKQGNDPEHGKPAKKPSNDVVKYSEKPVSDGNGKKGNEDSGKKPGTDVVPKGRRNDDITDVDFTETPRSKKLDSPSDKKSTDVTTPSPKKEDGPKSVSGPDKKEAPKLKSDGPKWGAEDVDFKETPRGEKPPKVSGPEKDEKPKSDKPASDSKKKPESKPKKDDKKPAAVDRIKEDEDEAST
jgi:hypothetical protein